MPIVFKIDPKTFLISRKLQLKKRAVFIFLSTGRKYTIFKWAEFCIFRVSVTSVFACHLSVTYIANNSLKTNKIF